MHLERFGENVVVDPEHVAGVAPHRDVGLDVARPEHHPHPPERAEVEVAKDPEGDGEVLLVERDLAVVVYSTPDAERAVWFATPRWKDKARIETGKGRKR